MTVNTFVLPFSMMSPKLHDVAAVVGLPMDGDKNAFPPQRPQQRLAFPSQ